MFLRINTGGISYLEPLTGSLDWYWGTDYTSGDLYEAEELFLDGHPIRCNRFILVHWPDGRVVEPIPAREGQYFGRPVYDNGTPVIFLADFPVGELRLLRYEDASGLVKPIVILPRCAAVNCYNLMPNQSPLCLTRQSGERFQIVWPDTADFAIHPAESFCFRENNKLYFSRWYEDPEYREEVVIRRFPDGEILDQFRGSVNIMSNGQPWLLTE